MFSTHSSSLDVEICHFCIISRVKKLREDSSSFLPPPPPPRPPWNASRRSDELSFQPGPGSVFGSCLSPWSSRVQSTGAFEDRALAQELVEGFQACEAAHLSRSRTLLITMIIKQPLKAFLPSFRLEPVLLAAKRRRKQYQLDRSSFLLSNPDSFFLER